MVRFLFSGGVAIVSVFSITICLAEPLPPPAKAFDYWQCISTPVPYGQKNCVEIRKQPVRETGNYDNWKMPVFCDPTINASVTEQMSINDEKTASDLTDDYAPPGYKLFPGVGFYKVHLENKTWSEARQICADEGTNTYLAIPSTVAEYAAIKSMLLTFVPENFTGMYVGISGLKKEGDFQTIFEQPLCTLPFVRWFSGNPKSSSETERCLYFGWMRSDKLADCFCDETLPFICEKPLPGRISDREY